MDSLFERYSENDDAEYKKIITSDLFKPAIPLIDSFWQKYSSYADAKFKDHLKTDFISRIWELWLGNVLLSKGFNLPEKETTDWPDFIASKDQNQFYIEAIAPNNSPHKSGNQIPELSPIVFQEIKSDLYELRIQDAVIKKYSKKYIEKIKKKSVPYIVAVNISKLPFAWFNFGDIPWIIKALYPIGPEAASIDRETNTFQSYRVKKKYNEKKSGHIKDKCIFSSSNYSLLSAIIFSDIPINLEEGKITEKLYIIKNPYALYPIEESFGCSEIVVDYNEEEFNIFVNKI